MILTKIREIFNSISSLNNHHAFDREMKFSDYIPVKYFAQPHIFVTDKNELGAVIQLKGLSFTLKSNDEILRFQERLSNFIKNLSNDYAFYFHTQRHQESISFSDDYKNGFAKDFMQDYEKQFFHSPLFVNDLYFTLIEKGNNSLIKKIPLKESSYRELFSQSQKNRMEAFQSTLSYCMDCLTTYQPQLLGEKTSENGFRYSEVLSFLSILVNAKKRDFLFPYNNIASFISEGRIFIGKDSIHFKSDMDNDDRYLAIISVKKYCAKTTAGMLNNLLNLPVEYVSSTSFHKIEKHKTLAMIEKQYKRLVATSDAASSQIEELEQALDDVASGKVAYGFHHQTIAVIAKEYRELNVHVSTVLKEFQNQGLVAVRETLNLKNAFFAQIPANFKFIKRKAPINTNNLTAFCSLHNDYAGYKDQNHLGGALILAETPNKTPLLLNIHEPASGRKDDFSKAHTLLVAPSNAGKTVLMEIVDTAFQKYNIQSFFFDRNQGCEVYIRAMGGKYYKLIPHLPTGFNPCQLEDTPINRKFFQDFLIALSSHHQHVLNFRDYKIIADVVDRNFSLSFDNRNLSNLSSFFPIDFSGIDSFSRYIRLPDRSGKGGDLSYLFDNETDTLTLDVNTIGFDLTHWLTETGNPPPELLPLSMYLFHRLEERLTKKRLTGIYLDEGWQFLNQPFWSQKIEEYLVTLRKENAFLFLATQLPDKLANCSIASALMQSTATHIFMANPKAQRKDYIDQFKLSEHEFEIVSNLEQTDRYFLIKQGLQSALCRIPLSHIQQYLPIFSSNSLTRDRCDVLREKLGENPDEWLKFFYQSVPEQKS